MLLVFKQLLKLDTSLNFAAPKLEVFQEHESENGKNCWLLALKSWDPLIGISELRRNPPKFETNRHPNENPVSRLNPVITVKKSLQNGAHLHGAQFSSLKGFHLLLTKACCPLEHLETSREALGRKKWHSSTETGGFLWVGNKISELCSKNMYNIYIYYVNFGVNIIICTYYQYIYI